MIAAITATVVFKAATAIAAATRTVAIVAIDVHVLVVTEGFEHTETPTPPSNARALQVPLVAHGEIDAAAEGPGGVSAAREHHARVRAELPLTALALSRSEPALETAYQTG